MNGPWRLADLADAFEGVIPSILATSSADGVPNISYLSHVVLIDERHVALSNQFFGKTLANLAANPQAAIIVVHGITGEQFRLDAVWLGNEFSGPVFDEVEGQLRASSSQIGMEDVMRLASVGIFRVEAITAIDRAAGLAPAVLPPRRSRLSAAAEVVAAVGAAAEAERIVAALLDGVIAGFDAQAAALFQLDPAGGSLVTLASRGYPATGTGSEVAMGEGIVGLAAAGRRVMRVADMSRVRRFGAAIRSSGLALGPEPPPIALPDLADAQSRIAVPMQARGRLYGVLFAESRERLAFRQEDAVALELVAGHAAACLLWGEPAEEEEPATPAPAPAAAAEAGGFRILHHRQDDSVFIDNDYLIRGVAGRLLVWLVESHLREGRLEFSNREIRLAPELRLPDYKDNLETRLLLLRQRLEERAAPVQLERAGRGLVRLRLQGRPRIETSG